MSRPPTTVWSQGEIGGRRGWPLDRDYPTGLRLELPPDEAAGAAFAHSLHALAGVLGA